MAARLNLVGAVALGLCAGGLSLGMVSGVQAQECDVDEDCQEGYGCDVGPNVSDVDCAPDNPACGLAPTETGVGSCEPKRLECEVDSDCPDGLRCEPQGDVACVALTPADGGMADPDVCGEVVERAGECVYVFVQCAVDEDCDSGELCSEIGSSSVCDAAPSTCTPGDNSCSDSVAEDCTEQSVMACLPAPIDCSAGQPCSGDTSCIELPEDVREGGPPGWDRSALCLPEAFALLVEGRAGASGQALDDVEGASADSQGRAPTDSQDLESASTPFGEITTAPNSKASGKDGSVGCSVAAGKSPGSSAMAAFLAAALGLLFVRRRRV